MTNASASPSRARRTLQRRRLRGRTSSRRVALVVPWLATAVLGLGAAGCLSGGPADEASAAATTTAQPPPAPNSDPNVIYDKSQVISEPFVLPTAKTDYLFSSGLGPSPRVPVRSYVHMGNWLKYVDALPTAPSWATSDTGVWAPDVRKIGNHYIMWFAAQSQSAPYGSPIAHPRCLSWAVAYKPIGPYSSISIPAHCDYSDYGDIDPRTVVFGGQEYLLWKSNDNIAPAPAPPTKIFIQKLASDGVTLEGSPVQLLTNNLPWEGTVVESPDMVQYNGQYYLFFSSTNGAQSPAAGIGVATCNGPMGPCADKYAGPWLGSNPHGAGPCEESLFQQHGATWVLYAPWANYYPGAYPVLAVSRVGFGKHLPYVAQFAGAQPQP